MPRGLELGMLPYWFIVAALFVLGIMALPSIGWLLIAIALCLSVLGAMRSTRAVAAPIGAGILGVIFAYVVLAPGFCLEGAASGAGGTDTTCTSLASVPLGGENWVPFLIAGPLITVAAVVFARRSMRPRVG